MRSRPLAILLAAALAAAAFTASPAPAAAKKKPKKCRKYVPGEAGKGAKTSVVTNAATEKKPVEVTLETAPGVGVGGNEYTETGISHAYHNVQVDSKAKSAGLWVRLEMPAYEDQDLYLQAADGTDLAHAAGFNPAPAAYNDTEGGGHTEEGAEQLDGVLSADCAGYTVDVAAATGFGGEVTLKFWLGKANYVPGS